MPLHVFQPYCEEVGLIGSDEKLVLRHDRLIAYDEVCCTNKKLGCKKRYDEEEEQSKVGKVK